MAILLPYHRLITISVLCLGDTYSASISDGEVSQRHPQALFVFVLFFLHTSDIWAAPSQGDVSRLREKLFRNISLTITHLPDKLNIEADKASREFHDDMKWSLNAQAYQT